MRLIIVLLVGLAAGAAGATTYDNAEGLRSLVQEYRKLKYMQTLTAQDIIAVSCRADTNAVSIPGPSQGARNETPDLTVVPSDAGWAQLLQTLNAVLNSKAAAAKAELEALGVTNVP